MASNRNFSNDPLYHKKISIGCICSFIFCPFVVMGYFNYFYHINHTNILYRVFRRQIYRNLNYLKTCSPARLIKVYMIYCRSDLCGIISILARNYLFNIYVL